MNRTIVCDNSMMTMTFKIESSDLGTCFQYDYLNWSSKISRKIVHPFLITARHLFPGVPNGAEVDFQIHKIGSSDRCRAPIYFSAQDDIDIAVIDMYGKGPLEVYYPVTFGTYSIGERAFFCGYPFGMYTNSPSLNNGYPLPIVHNATLSGFDTNDKIFIFNGDNVKGFSGSPIGFHDVNTHETHIIGVVTDYIPQVNKMKVGQNYLAYTENAGMFRAFSLAHALGIMEDLDKRNILNMP